VTVPLTAVLSGFVTLNVELESVVVSIGFEKVAVGPVVVGWSVAP